MQKTYYWPIIILLCTLVFSCEKNAHESLEVSSSFWGHLKLVGQTTRSNLFLSHFKNGDYYRICAPKYLFDEMKGLEAEIYAAVNIWGHYIGREINVEIIQADLPRPEKNLTESELMNQYYSLCPNQIDLVLGRAYFKDSALGKTTPQYSYQVKNGKREVVDFKRALFLREEEQLHPKWKTLADEWQRDLTKEEILEVLIQRSHTLYLPNDHEYLTLHVLTHEFGHIWGLCDQYELGGNLTNCDPNHSTINDEGHIILNPDSTMNKAGWINKLFLTDDDITGIQKLGLRDDVYQTDLTEEDLKNIPLPISVQEKEIKYAKVQEFVVKNNVLQLTLALVTQSNQSKVSIKVYDQISEKWINASVYKLTSPEETRNFIFESHYHKDINPLAYEVTISTQHEEVILKGKFKE